MSNARRVIITDEDAVKSSIEDLKEVKTEEIEAMFDFAPIQVDEVPRKDTSVEVIPLRDDHFFFGGTWYYLTKGKPQKVPVEVRDFLLKNKKQPRIKDIW